MFLSDGFTATAAARPARSAWPPPIGGQLDCDGAALRNDGPAPHADSRRLTRACSSARVHRHWRRTHRGAVNLAGARIGYPA